jgi:hypothetical protein
MYIKTKYKNLTYRIVSQRRNWSELKHSMKASPRTKMGRFESNREMMKGIPQISNDVNTRVTNFSDIFRYICRYIGSFIRMQTKL